MAYRDQGPSKMLGRLADAWISGDPDKLPSMPNEEVSSACHDGSRYLAAQDLIDFLSDLETAQFNRYRKQADPEPLAVLVTALSFQLNATVFRRVATLLAYHPDPGAVEALGLAALTHSQYAGTAIQCLGYAPHSSRATEILQTLAVKAVGGKSSRAIDYLSNSRGVRGLMAMIKLTGAENAQVREQAIRSIRSSGKPTTLVEQLARLEEASIEVRADSLAVLDGLVKHDVLQQLMRWLKLPGNARPRDLEEVTKLVRQRLTLLRPADGHADSLLRPAGHIPTGNEDALLRPAEESPEAESEKQGLLGWVGRLMNRG